MFAPDRAGRPQTSSPFVQPKLAIGQVSDPLEHEANRVADQVMRMSAPKFTIGPTPPQISRKCEACEEEERQMLQTKPAGWRALAAEASSIVHEVLRSPG